MSSEQLLFNSHDASLLHYDQIGRLSQTGCNEMSNWGCEWAYLRSQWFWLAVSEWASRPSQIHLMPMCFGGAAGAGHGSAVPLLGHRAWSLRGRWQHARNQNEIFVV
jgi:hypothetical protein